MAPLDPDAEARVFASARSAASFFMGDSDVHRALERIVAALAGLNVPYAIVGAMALNEYGYRRVTEDVDILLTREGLAVFKEAFLGRGYVEKFAGSKGVRDTVSGVKPKPICFPDPALVAVQGAHLALLPLERLIELKLASGMTAPHRLRDLADVLELIRIQALPEDYAERLDPYVCAKFLELWQAASFRDPE